MLGYVLPGVLPDGNYTAWAAYDESAYPAADDDDYDPSVSGAAAAAARRGLGRASGVSVPLLLALLACSLASLVLCGAEMRPVVVEVAL